MPHGGPGCGGFSLSRLVALVVLGALVLAGCVNPAAEIDALSARPELPERPAVVIAVIDTGINFYHEEYRQSYDPATRGSPPASTTQMAQELGIEALLTEVPIQLDLAWDAAVEADREVLVETLQPRTLYTFPGTRILGAISFQDSGGQRCVEETCVEWPLILDFPGGHGTMTTSRAVGNTISIGGQEPDIYLVMVQGFTPEALDWVAEQDWIDIASISAGLSFAGIAPGVPTAGEAAGLSDAIPAYNRLSHAKPFFASTGNGVGNAGVLGFPSWLRGSSGVPDAISVGANNNDEMSHWHNQDPYISADGCDNPSADSDDTESVSNYGGGTSSATPFSAGGGAKLLLEARRLLNDTHVGPRVASEPLPTEGWSSGRAEDASVVLAQGEPGLVPDGPLADGVFTLAEFKQTLYMTAIATPTDDESDGDKCAPLAGGFPGGENLPAAARFPIHGYGEINHASIEAALAVIRGEAPMPERPEDDAQYALARERKMLVVGDAES